VHPPFRPTVAAAPAAAAAAAAAAAGVIAAADPPRRPAPALGARLTVTRGASCTSLDEAHLVVRDRLDAFPSSPATAVLGEDVWAPGERRASRFALEPGDDPAPEARSARWDVRPAVDALDVSAVQPSTAGRAGTGRSP